MARQAENGFSKFDITKSKAMRNIEDIYDSEPSAAEEPAKTETPTEARQDPAEENAPAAKQESAEEKAPSTKQDPTEENAPSAKQDPAEEKAPAVKQEPAEENVSVAKQEPAEENAPSEQKSVEEIAPVPSDGIAGPSSSLNSGMPSGMKPLKAEKGVKISLPMKYYFKLVQIKACTGKSLQDLAAQGVMEFIDRFSQPGRQVNEKSDL